MTTVVLAAVLVTGSGWLLVKNPVPVSRALVTSSQAD
jgi:hypothetical protein